MTSSFMSAEEEQLGYLKLCKKKKSSTRRKSLQLQLEVTEWP